QDGGDGAGHAETVTQETERNKNKFGRTLAQRGFRVDSPCPAGDSGKNALTGTMFEPTRT
ncbi:hypothetical protein, partial [Azospirillum baldaniorum]|uniref:hypothetical protein n=1 Tax=Azospirillum baldaniorum TaxID=1064539 RepID=UPI001B3B6395